MTQNEMKPRAMSGLARLVFLGMLVASPSSHGQTASRISVERDVIYGHKLGMALTLDVIRPATPNGAGVLFMNSAGFNSPRFDYLIEDGFGVRLRTAAEIAKLRPAWHQFSPRPLVERGFTVFDIRHGSSPKFTVPEAVADVRQAVRFLRSRAGDYGVDPYRLGVWGGSAGGHLALLLGMNPESSDADGRIAAVVAYYPISDWERQMKRLRTQFPSQLDERPALRFPPEQYRELSPVRFASADDPPTLIIHGRDDVDVPLAQGEAAHRALADAGAITELLVLEGAGHTFRDEHAEVALAATVAWFVRYLGAEPR